MLIQGDLSPLTPAERVDYYKRVCYSLGLNPLTSPFTYILFRENDGGPAKLSLYANKDCAAQLRKIHRVSVIPPLRREIRDEMCIVEADLRDGHGKTDTATGIVALYKYKDNKRIALTGREWANAVMKTETKAKRRGTLSICGLAFLDESELDTMEIVGGVTREGRIYYHEGQEPTFQHGSHEAAQKVLQAKLAGEMPLNPPDEPKAPPVPQEQAKPVQPAIFFTMLAEHHGHYALFVNLKEFLITRPDLEEPLRQLFTAHKGRKTKAGTTLVPAEELQALLEKLAGYLGLSVKELKGH